MELKVREYELIEKLRAMIKQENDPELIAEYMREIAKLERQKALGFRKAQPAETGRS